MSVIIDFKIASEYTGGEKDFLRECLEDLVRDAEKSGDQIAAGMSEKDFKKIKDAAHLIKGCSSYLGCHRLRDASFAVEQVAKTGMASDSADHDALVKEEVGLLEVYKSCIEEVRAEIRKALA